ncbi:sodium-translocating pyrophosphatase [Thalassoglobus sp. JC818]|uniref:sodium-translocating pyrophosphatase n=1 Tax=Thalassoglobus sp. JC818 TaxID=3232136 RepID=UPI00345A3747
MRMSMFGVESFWSNRPQSLLRGGAAVTAALISGPVFGAETTEAAAPVFSVAFSWLVAVAGSVAALYYAYFFFKWMLEQDEGDDLMVKIAGYVREGADAYLWRQYRVVGIFFAVTSLLLMVVAFGFNALSGVVPIAFLSGGFFSALAGWCGMKTATLASARTAQACKTSLNSGLQVAFRSGAVMGLTVVGLGLLDICLWFGVLYWIFPLFGADMTLEEITVTMLCFGMGASSQALFARVGGGIFTKAADVGADLVGKVEAGIPEDDPRNPATIADNVGDNVGDVAGMGADLYESYCGSILASAAIGVAAYHGHIKMQLMLLLLPMVLAGLGIGLSIVGVFLVQTDENADQKKLLRALGNGINGSSIGVALVAAVLVYLMLVLPSSSMSEELAAEGLRYGSQLFGVFAAVLVGLFSGIVIGWWTEYSTSDVYSPTKRIADQAVTGPATVIIAGVAEGLYSVWVPIVVIGVAIVLAFGACTGFQFGDLRVFAMGLYGVAIAAVGMLSTLGITLATDAYGPIADNAGGNAEMSKQDPQVRQRTDALDSLGNTTAATGKGFAIGSAALTALALLAAYLEEVRVGFDRWADSVEVALTENLTEGQAHVVRSGVLAVRTTDDVKANDAYLVFPPISRVQSEQTRDVIGPDAKVGEVVTLNLVDLVDRGMVVPARTARMPDFVRYYDVTIMNPRVLVGMFMGVMLAFVFCAMTMKAVGRSAKTMVEEVRRQFREIPGILEGTGEPDYAACVDISTGAAQREMIVPALLGLLVPVAVGLVLGVGGVMGMLAGGLTSGFAVAIMMSNAGGAWDNAKKYIESGAHGGKGTDAHKAAVVGDTVGDPFKDTSGPSLNILIKLMSMVSVVFAGLIVQYALNF